MQLLWEYHKCVRSCVLTLLQKRSLARRKTAQDRVQWRVVLEVFKRSYFSARRLGYLVQFNDVIWTVTFGKGGPGEPEAFVPRCQCGQRFTMLSFSVCCEAGEKVCEVAATAGKGRAACYGWQSFHLLSARDFLSSGSSPALWKAVQYYKRMYF